MPRERSNLGSGSRYLRRRLAIFYEVGNDLRPLLGSDSLVFRFSLWFHEMGM